MTEPAPLEAVGTVIIRGSRILYASPLVAALTERGDALVGTDPLELLAPEDRARRGAVRPPAARRADAVGLRGGARPPAGGRRVVELSVQVDGRDVVVRVRDVSAR